MGCKGWKAEIASKLNFNDYLSEESHLQAGRDKAKWEEIRCRIYVFPSLGYSYSQAINPNACPFWKQERNLYLEEMT